MRQPINYKQHLELEQSLQLLCRLFVPLQLFTFNKAVKTVIHLQILRT